MAERKSKENPKYEIAYGKTLNLQFPSYASVVQNLVLDFTDHFEKNGLAKWKGKSISSDNVPYYYPNCNELADFARQNNLWHAHIGFREWKRSRDSKIQTSDWVVHFKKVSEYKIILLSLGSHNPMEIPSEALCNEQ